MEQYNKEIYVATKYLKTWQTQEHGPVSLVYTPLENIQIKIGNRDVIAAPFKTTDKISKSNVTIKEVKNIMEQNNYTNQCLETLGNQLNRIEKNLDKTTSSIPELHKPSQKDTQNKPSMSLLKVEKVKA